MISVQPLVKIGTAVTRFALNASFYALKSLTKAPTI